MQRNFNAVGEFRHHALAVQRNDFHLGTAKILQEKTAGRTERIVSVRNGELDGNDAHFQGVAGLRAFDVNRAGEHVTARPAVGGIDAGLDVAQGLFHQIARHARGHQPLGVRGEDCFHFDAVAGLHVQDGRAFRVVTAPDHRFRRDLEVVKRAVFLRAQGKCG